MATDWIKYHLDGIEKLVNSDESVHVRMGGIGHHIRMLMDHYETGIIIHHKNKQSMSNNRDELKHYSDPGEVKEETKEPAAEAAGTQDGDTKGTPE